LLTISYKLASLCIAERVKHKLDDLVDEDQKGFVQGRFIGENTRLMFDIMLKLNKTTFQA
jgi:hypothetical protein